jgi:hypothetical protein
VSTVEQPFLVVVRGRPDDEEIAAATLAMLALARSRTPTTGDSRTKAPGWVAEPGYTPPGCWSRH